MDSPLIIRSSHPGPCSHASPLWLESASKRAKLSHASTLPRAYLYPQTRTDTVTKPKVQPSRIPPLSPLTASRLNIPMQSLHIARTLFPSPKDSQHDLLDTPPVLDIPTPIRRSAAKATLLPLAIRSNDEEVSNDNHTLPKAKVHAPGAAKNHSAYRAKASRAPAKTKATTVKVPANPEHTEVYPVRAVLGDTSRRYVVDWKDSTEGTRYHPTLVPKKDVNEATRQDWELRMRQEQDVLAVQEAGGSEGKEDDHDFEVEDVLDVVVIAGMRYCKVVRAGDWEEDKVTWEPAAHLTKAMLQEPQRAGPKLLRSC